MKIDTDEIRKRFVLPKRFFDETCQMILILCNAYDAKCAEVEELKGRMENMMEHIRLLKRECALNHPDRVGKVTMCKDNVYYTLMILKEHQTPNGIYVEVKALEQTK